jgi:hypothetical protein
MLSSPAGAISNTGVYVVQPGSGAALNLKTTNTPTGSSMVVIDGGSVVLPSGDKITLDKGNANLSQQGFNADTGIYWGRWQATVPLTGGQNPPTANGIYQTMYSPHVTNASELATLKNAASGTNANPVLVNATYTYVGGTTPVRSDGQSGQINSMTVGANFSTQKITQYDVNLQFGAGNGAQVWDTHLDPSKASNATFANFSGTGPSVTGGGPGIGLNGKCTNCTNGDNISGNARGLFTGNDARGLMTTFELQNGANGAIVTGAGALKRQ